MTKTIAVFGAGAGLGAAVARRFGAEGYQVALVARRPEALEELRASLAAEGVVAAAFPADLTRTEEVPALLAAIVDRFGAIDAIEYAPISGAPFAAAADLDPEVLEGFLALYLLTPVAIVRSVLPGMLERGEGAILLGHGATAVHPAPFMSGVGPAMAAARNYLVSLHGEVADRGVYVGSVAVAAGIIGSAFLAGMTSGGAAPGADASAFPTVHPDAIAEQLWSMYRTRDVVEVVYPPLV